MAKAKPVPELGQYTQAMNRQQAGFYRRWKNAWARGEALDIEGYTGYVRCYAINDISYDQSVEDRLNELLHLSDNYGMDIFYEWIYGCYIHLKQYDKALEILQSQLQLGLRQETLVSNIWSLKLVTDDQINGRELLSMYGPQVTKFGRQHLDKIADYLNLMLTTYETEHNINLIEEWSKNSHSWRNPRDPESSPISYSYRDNSATQSFIKEITRLAENVVREEGNLPHVGEGWLSETELYNHIRVALPDFEVKQHFSPTWLGRQHLDIFVPALNIALEYQGIQHDEPIAYFGGQEAFEKNQERDRRKKRLCTKHGVHIVFVRPGYDLPEVLAEIQEHAPHEINFEESSDMAVGVSSQGIKDNFEDNLLQIDASTEAPEPPKYEYQLPEGFYVEPLKLDPDYKVSPKTVKRHNSLANEISSAYKQRNSDPDAIDKVILLCKEQIELSVEMAHYQYQDRLERRDWCLEQADASSNDAERKQHYLETAENNMKMRRNHYGYRRIINIYERQHRFEDALRIAVKANSEHWDPIGYWDKIIVRLLAQMGK